MMYSRTERFEQVKLTGYKTVPCTLCGGRMRRQKTFSQTINPWNKSKKYPGELKGYSEICEELEERISQWKKISETHESCEEFGV